MTTKISSPVEVNSEFMTSISSIQSTLVMCKIINSELTGTETSSMVLEVIGTPPPWMTSAGDSYPIIQIFDTLNQNNDANGLYQLKEVYEVTGLGSGIEMVTYYHINLYGSSHLSFIRKSIPSSSILSDKVRVNWVEVIHFEIAEDQTSALCGRGKDIFFEYTNLTKQRSKSSFETIIENRKVVQASLIECAISTDDSTSIVFLPSKNDHNVNKGIKFTLINNSIHDIIVGVYGDPKNNFINNSVNYGTEVTPFWGVKVRGSQTISFCYIGPKYYIV